MMLFWLLVVGVVAQFVDATLGMAFGLTSTTMLTLLGTAPAAASASVHTAEIGTTLISGLAHWRAGNVDRRVLVRLAVPGALGALFGALLLSTFSLTAARPFIASILLVLGLILVARFGLRPSSGSNKAASREPSTRLLAPLGLVAGFIDASGGGGWGPIATPTLLTLASASPRRVIGTVSAAEFLVSLAAVLGFVSGSAYAGVDLRIVAALLLGGALIAPFAARLVRRLDPQRFGLLVGLLVVLFNGDALLRLASAPGLLRLGFLFGVGVLGVYVRLRSAHLLIEPTATDSRM